MTALLTMPRMGETMEVGRIATWLKKPGDSFRRGETILEIETDKTTVEVPALDDGRLMEIIAGEGTEVAVGDAVGRYDRSSANPAAPAASPTEAPEAPQPARAAARTALTMPRMGETMEEGRVVAWLKQPGEAFRRGEVVIEVETDKTTVEVPALDDGTLSAIVAHPGTTVAVGDPIGYFTPRGEATKGTDPLPAAPNHPAAPVAVPRPVAPHAWADPSSGAAGPTRPRATPLARRIARQSGMDLAGLTGSGRRGRIEARDVEAAGPSRSAPASGVAAVSTPGVLFLDLPAGRMAYREWVPAAARGTMLFLHGFSADSTTWAGFLSGLGHGGLRVVAPDLPGHGATGIEAASPGDMTAAIAALADRLGLQGCHLVAHSMGAAVALRAVAAGLRPGRMTLIAPAGLGGEIDADFIHGIARVRTAGALSHLLRRLARRVPPLSPAQLGHMAEAFAQGRLTQLADALVDGGRQAVDILPDLHAARVPIRIVWGVEDRIVPWTQVAQVPAAVPIHLIAGAGHMPHWDNPQDFVALFA